jgi:hypothetical protein
MPGFGARLLNWFKRPKKPKAKPESRPEPEPKLMPEPQLRPEPQPPSEKIGSGHTMSERIRRVAESLLENERLTSDLDDSAAQELLDWGLSVGRQIVQGTANVDDDEQAEEAMYPRLRATRSMMRAVNRWIASQRKGDIDGREKAFNDILEQASVIYGRPLEAMNEKQRAALASTPSKYADDPPQMIAHLRELLEHPEDIPND